MTDIVERLRKQGDWRNDKTWDSCPIAEEAADEIERLREENAQLKVQHERDKRLNHETESGLLEENVRLREETDEWEKSHNTLVEEIERLRALLIQLEVPHAPNAYKAFINIARLEQEKRRRLARDEGTKAVEKSFEQLNSEAAELRKRIAELEASNNQLLLRCQAMFSLLPDETKIGDIQRAVAALTGKRENDY